MQERTSQWGKGKPIYSGDALGNRMGKEERKKGFGKDLTHVRGKQTKGEHGAVQGVGLQSGTAGFQKEFH